MKEERIFFGEGERVLEGLLATRSGLRNAVICHPHSLMGGDMENPVVETIARSLFEAGFTTLRFNFRGVGASSGVFDEGRGERDDLLAAVTCLEVRSAKGALLTGYSFGAWVIAGLLGQRDMTPSILVAPPMRLLPFDFDLLIGKVGIIICGDRDPYCPVAEIRQAAETIHCRLEILSGADHFFSSAGERLSAAIRAFVDYPGMQKRDDCPATE